MARPKTAVRRARTKTDMRELKTFAKQKIPISKIARALKRTEGATRQNTYTLGISLNSRG